MDFKKLIESKEYDFLRTNEHLGNRLILLGLGGSWAYGTNIETSDIDLRGCALNSKEQILTNQNFEQFVNNETDTTIYSFNKLVSLLSNCNPNTIEILGLRPQDYFILTDIGKLLLDNSNIFLSKKAGFTFGCYAKSQLNRLTNRSGRANEEIVQNEGRSLNKVIMHIRERHPLINKESFGSYVKDDKIYLNMEFRDMSMEEILEVFSEVSNVHSQYKKSVRNQKAIEHSKLNKHSMHLIRLFMMGIDILKDHEIKTYRDGSDHDLLMRIRNGEFLEDDQKTPTKDFEELVKEYSRKFDEATNTSTLPEKPDYKRINKFMMNINEIVVRGDIN